MYIIIFSLSLSHSGVAQTIRSEDETKKKHLATSYHELTELLLSILEKKTTLISELGSDLTTQNFDSTMENLETIDESCRNILHRSPHPSSLRAVIEIVHHLQAAIEKFRFTASAMSLSSSKNVDN